MSEEPIKKILKDIGLTEKETELYIFLAKFGELKGKEIAKQTRIDNAEVYRILRKLQSKGILEATLEAPTRFTTVPLDKLIDAYVKARRDEAAQVERAKQELLEDWRKISKPAAEPQVEKFLFLEGNNRILTRIFQLEKEAEKQILIVASPQDLLHSMPQGLLDGVIKHPLRSRIQFRLLTEISEKNLGAMKSFFKKMSQTVQNFEGRTPNLGLPLPRRMIIRDDEELLLFTKPATEIAKPFQGDSCLWTNCKALVQTFTTVFSEVWGHSIEAERKIMEIEVTEPAPVLTICDPETVMMKYDETMRAAKEEIIMMTSCEAAGKLLKDTSLLNMLTEKNVPVKIMAPIVDINVSKSLPVHCEIRHSPEPYIRTTLVDGRHLFQFRNAPAESKPQTTTVSELAIYTNSYSNVQKIKQTLYDVWKKARNTSSAEGGPFGNRSETVVGSLWDETELGRSAYRFWLFNLREREKGTITEKDIINKIINAKRLSAKDPKVDMNIQYGSKARAIIHLPSHIDLPNLIISAFHDNKQSSFGAEDRLEISMWMETPKGHAFVPVAHVTDNPKASEWRNGVFAGTPAGQNGVLVKKNQLKVTLQGNTLFAGWTIPIPLVPPKYVLPPACILFEGHGELETYIIRTGLPSGRTQVNELNEYRAFVTFFHQASTYQGPRADGYFDREYIMTAYPPSSKIRNKRMTS